MSRTASNDRPSGAPRLNLAGGKQSWRDREASKNAASAAGSNGPSRTGTPMERTDSNERPTERASGPPRLPLAGKQTWREREAAKQAAAAAGSQSGSRDRESAPSPAPTQAPTETLKPSGAPGKWVPRHLRERQG
ncbi:hypothetical protein PC116_g31032 [Phytophthora cactorum]|nr:hypothetical protein PC116_g31032 [Phytophthora cactorum]